MTRQQVEAEVIQLIHREPFVPFVVEMSDGNSIEILHPRLALTSGGAVFFGTDGGLVDFDFDHVCALRPLTAEAVA